MAARPNYAQRFAFRVCSGESAEIEDGVTHDLARPVKCDIATAVAIEEFYAASARTSCDAITLDAVALRPSVITGACSSRRSTSPIFPSFRSDTSCCCRLSPVA